ncbi:MAG: hypothetical protein D6B28_06470 [Gammaproteobacteria bacterium]|nr:MAG: hypothetical protein D6B28_06470 [Gammaproteobacteria bacterium]
MSNIEINLDFSDFSLQATLLDNAIATKLAEILPVTVVLQQWGDEVYGSIGKDLGEANPVPQIPPGGIAYTNNGDYLCIFFGQTPAWPVEYIGQIKDDSWKRLLKQPAFNSVTVSAR